MALRRWVLLLFLQKIYKLKKRCRYWGPVGPFGSTAANSASNGRAPKQSSNMARSTSTSSARNPRTMANQAGRIKREEDESRIIAAAVAAVAPAASKETRLRIPALKDHHSPRFRSPVSVRSFFLPHRHPERVLWGMRGVRVKKRVFWSVSWLFSRKIK